MTKRKDILYFADEDFGSALASFIQQDGRVQVYFAKMTGLPSDEDRRQMRNGEIVVEQPGIEALQHLIQTGNKPDAIVVCDPSHTEEVHRLLTPYADIDPEAEAEQKVREYPFPQIRIEGVNPDNADRAGRLADSLANGLEDLRAKVHAKARLKFDRRKATDQRLAASNAPSDAGIRIVSEICGLRMQNRIPVIAAGVFHSRKDEMSQAGYDMVFTMSDLCRKSPGDVDALIEAIDELCSSRRRGG